MATTILPFVIRPRPPASVSGGQARIIIFPGVRYETVDGPSDTGSPKDNDGSPRKRKSKTR